MPLTFENMIRPNVWRTAGILTSDDERGWLISRLRIGLFALAVVFSQVANADPLDDCNRNDPALVISGCTVMVERGGLGDTQLEVAYSRRSDALLATGKLDEAIADREKALTLNPDDSNLKQRLADAYLLRGDVYFKGAKLGKALDDYTKAIKLNSSDHAALARRSELFLAKDDISKAIADLVSAWELNKNISLYRERLVKLYQAQAAKQSESQDFDDAINSLTEALMLAPKNVELLTNRGIANTEVGKFKQALEDYTEAIRLKSDYFRAYRLRGEFYLQHALDINFLAGVFGSNVYDEARTDFESALKLVPQNTEILMLRALSYEKDGMPAKAIDDYETVLKNDHQNKEAKSGATRSAKEREKLARLIQIELKRLGCDPGSIDGKWGKSSKRALAQYSKCNEHTPELEEPTGSILSYVTPWKIGSKPIENVCANKRLHRIHGLGLTVKTAECRKGALIVSVANGSRAGRAGLKSGMIIKSISTVFPIAFTQVRSAQDLVDRTNRILGRLEKDGRMFVNTGNRLIAIE